MTLRAFLPLSTYPDPTPEEALTILVEAAAALQAELTTVIHEVDIPPVDNPVANRFAHLQEMSAAAEAFSHARGLELRSKLEHLCERSNVRCSVEVFRTQRPAGDSLASRARTFDLTMIACSPDSPDHALLVQDIMFGSGGPVMIVPPVNTRFHLDLVSIAWDGGRAAARVLRDSLPIVALAKRVELLTCTEDKPISAVSIRDVTQFLAAHEIQAEQRTFGLEGLGIGDALQKAAADNGAGLLVMGAFGHTRLREFILGGATASALRFPKLPILVSH